MTTPDKFSPEWVAMALQHCKDIMNRPGDFTESALRLFIDQDIERHYPDVLAELQRLQTENAKLKKLVEAKDEALGIISQTVHEHGKGPCDCINSGACITEWCDSAVARKALALKLEDMG